MTCRFKPLFLIFLFSIAMAFASGPSFASERNERESLFDSIAPAVVKLTLRLNGLVTHIGTGFFISADGIIATNRHVLRNFIHEKGYTLEVSTYADRQGLTVKNFEVGSCGENSDADLCLIRLPIKSAKFLSLSARRPLVGDTVFTIGHPGDRNFAYSTGRIQNFEFNSSESEEMTMTTPLGPGSSGGPIFDRHGDLVGVASKYAAPGSLDQYAVSFSEIKKVLQSRQFFRPVSVAREEISLALAKRSRQRWQRETFVLHTFHFRGEFAESLTVSLPKNFETCREVSAKSGSIFACVNSEGTDVFTIQRFDALASNPMINGRKLLEAKPLEILEKRRDLSSASPLEEKRLDVFYSKPLPATCTTFKSGSFTHQKGCEFTVLNDTEPAARSKNLWIRKGSQIYSFSTWASDPSQGGAFNELPASAARSAHLLKSKNEAQEVMRTRVLMPFEWLQPESSQLRTPLLSSSRDR